MKSVVLIGAGPRIDIGPIEDSFIVCCDGGYRYLKEKGIEPDLLVGDFDTFPKESIGKPKEIITLNPMKDDTDSFHAVSVLLERGYRDFRLYGLYGGRRDRTIASLNLLAYLKDHQAQGILYSDDNKSKRMMIENESVILSGLEKAFVSVFSYSDWSYDVSIEGLKYTLSHKDIPSSTSLCCSNEFIGKEAKIQVGKGRLRIIRPKEALWKKEKSI